MKSFITAAQHDESNLKVMAAMFGIRSLSDHELQDTLSSLYLDGFKAGKESNAAPQMLEALKLIRDTTPSNHMTGDTYSALINAIAAATKQ